MKWFQNVAVGVGLSLGAGASLADQYHYMNILQGDRAQGMGGAFTAIADDASGRPGDRGVGLRPSHRGEFGMTHALAPGGSVTAELALSVCV